MHINAITAHDRFRVDKMSCGSGLKPINIAATLSGVDRKINMSIANQKKLLVVQYGGDYRDAYRNISEGKSEYYANQRYSVDAVSDLKDSFDEVATLCCQSAGRYSEVMAPGVRAIGVSTKTDTYAATIKKAIAAIREYAPSMVILRTPAVAILRWLRKQNIPTALILADSFNSRRFGDRWHYRRLARECNHPNVQWIGNHGVGSCLSLRNIGIAAGKIVPWDWPVSVDPGGRSAKDLGTVQPYRLIYVGAISVDKGVTDCVAAVDLLLRSGVPVALDIYGKGQVDECRALAAQRGLQRNVTFCGLVPNREIIPRMAEADVVLIPSRRTYPEGFPKTINEGLCSRTPLVVSDHPIFARLLKSRQNAMVFQSGSAEDLAAKVRELLASPELYRSLSDNAYDTWQSLQIAVKWGDLFRKIALADHEWLNTYRLDSGLYNLSE